jgi:hypothetical protein
MRTMWTLTGMAIAVFAPIGLYDFDYVSVER